MAARRFPMACIIQAVSLAQALARPYSVPKPPGRFWPLIASPRWIYVNRRWMHFTFEADQHCPPPSNRRRQDSSSSRQCCGGWGSSTTKHILRHLKKEAPGFAIWGQGDTAADVQPESNVSYDTTLQGI
jgi:hypothetical protein